MSVKITSKGQVTLPKIVRDYLKVNPGDEVSFRFAFDGAVVVEPKVSLMLLKGSVKTDVKDVTIEDMNDAVTDEGSGS